MELLSAEENAAYWNTRHSRIGDLRSGGHVSLDEPTNQMFYTVRLSILLDLIGHQSHSEAPLFVLDAGCGKGWFSRELAKFGHQVDGIDASEVALEHCRKQGGGAHYFHSALSAWSSPWLYDVVASIDVLFHILDDAEWEASVRNLASLVKLRGRLILADWGEEHDHVFGNYQVCRGRQRYVPLLRDCGMRFDEWRSYRFRRSPIGFYVFTRTG